MLPWASDSLQGADGRSEEISHAGFEWRRTEGKLNEIGLRVGMAGQLQDGLVRSAGFLEPTQLCFFEGKLDKELGTAARSREHPASSEGSSGHQEAARLQLEPREGPGGNKASTVQEPVAGKDAPEAKRQPDLDLPGAAERPGTEPEASVRNPSVHPGAAGWPGSRAAAPGEENGLAPGRRGGGGGSETSGQLERGPALPVAVAHPAPTAEHPPTATPPSTVVEAPQECSGASAQARGHDKELEQRSPEEGALPAPTLPKKAVRRALSECAHLAVPPAAGLTDKHPELPAREELPPGRQPPPSGPEPVPTPRPQGAPAVRRSMTVAEEQTAGCRLNPGELPVLSSLCKAAAAAKREESTHLSSSCSSVAGREELERIPEVSSQDKGRAGASGASTDSCPHACQAGAQQPGQGALAGEKAPEVTAAQSAPSSLCEETPRDGMFRALPPRGQAGGQKEPRDGWRQGARQPVPRPGSELPATGGRGGNSDEAAPASRLLAAQIVWAEEVGLGVRGSEGCGLRNSFLASVTRPPLSSLSAAPSQLSGSWLKPVL